MLDIAIVGGGLCGLSLANRLQDEGRSFQLFESRQDLGGRIHTVFEPVNKLAIDMGAAWFWPENQPLITELIASLSLSSFPQYDTGKVMVLNDMEKGPKIHGTESVHGGAYRVDGGLGQMIAALAATLPEGTISIGHALTAVEDNGDTVKLTFKTGEKAVSVEAKQVVLAVPPRLLAERVTFTPPLPEEVKKTLEGTETWMAGEAKAAVTYPRSLWREDGFSGSAFVSHEMAMLAEIFDVGAPEGEPGALAGFVALDPDTRASFEGGLPLLIANQMTQVFGSAAENGEVLYKNWAAEPDTCSFIDRITPSEGRRDFGNPLLRRPHWNAKLHFAGSESAHSHAGQMEGALQVAERIACVLLRSSKTANETTSAVTLSDFTDWMKAQDKMAIQTYRRSLNRLLATHQSQGATRQAAKESIRILFEEALTVIANVDLTDTDTGPGTASSIMSPIKEVSGGVLNTLVAEIIEYNRTSCALSNFADEHQLTEDYIRAILKDASELGGAFLTEAYAIITTRAEAA